MLAGDKVIGREPGPGIRDYYHSDLLGTTRAVLQGGAIVESHDYDPWGVSMAGRTLGSGTKEEFTAKERDVETGLDYFGARYYMSALGRWAGVDPVAEKHPAWSPYNYVLNNPLVLVDPDGKQVYVNPVFDAGIAYGAWQGVTASVTGLASAIAHPIRTAEALGALATDPGTQALALISAVQSVQEGFNTLLDGDDFSAGMVVGRVLEGAGELAIGSKGLVGIASVVSEDAAAAARVGSAARDAADAAQLLRSDARAAAALEKDGRIFTDISGRRPLHPDVEQMAARVPKTEQLGYHGACAELNCMSAAKEAGVDLRGSRMSTVNVRKPGHALHATPKPACPTCRNVARQAGVRIIE